MKVELHGCSEPVDLARRPEMAGLALDLRCGGNGSCGRCRVRLLEGTYSIDGKVTEILSPGLDANACRTVLLSPYGRIEIPESSRVPSFGKILTGWVGGTLVSKPETVIGIDLGTTTVAAIKICDGKMLGEASCFNAQNRFGDNVIARIAAAGASSHDLDGLRRAAEESICDLLDRLGTEDVTSIAIAGNTVMSCLFHGIDPTPIGVMPFRPPCRVFPIIYMRGIPVLTVPAISGYVGGDITAGLYETRLKPGEMLVDIGTNCEILFHTPSGMYCTAAAAGPAFEGAGILCGSRAVPGAIEHWSGDGSFSVIGGSEPKGMCGSAMIDFLAEARRRERLNEFGRICPASDSFPIAPGIVIHEWEIEQLLKAKAAVYAGVTTLSQHLKVSPDRIFLAGGFAAHLDIENAMSIGMLPRCEYKIVGNTSLAGAVRLAVQPEIFTELEKLIELPTELPLNTLPGFEDNYIDGLLLP